MQTLDRVLAALSAIRAPRTLSEYDLHALVSSALSTAGLPCLHEVRLAPRRRIDFMCLEVGIEIKKGRPTATPLLKQLDAYAQAQQVGALVLVAEHPPRLPQTISGKPLTIVSLQRPWGIAL